MRQVFFILAIFFLISSSISCFAQESTPILLHSPKDWRYEKMDLPLDFAPDFKYEGFEELRFAPGMFDTLSTTYFTYLFAIGINDKSEFLKSELELFLLEYYKGLCNAVAKSNELSVDTSKIKIEIEDVDINENYQNYNAQIVFFDVFTNGQKIILNLELEVILISNENKLYILALVSPQEKQADIWNELHDIRTQIQL